MINIIKEKQSSIVNDLIKVPRDRFIPIGGENTFLCISPSVSIPDCTAEIIARCGVGELNSEGQNIYQYVVKKEYEHDTFYYLYYSFEENCYLCFQIAETGKSLESGKLNNLLFESERKFFDYLVSKGYSLVKGK